VKALNAILAEVEIGGIAANLIKLVALSAGICDRRYDCDFNLLNDAKRASRGRR
jgi:hypothetical protein